MGVDCCRVGKSRFISCCMLIKSSRMEDRYGSDVDSSNDSCGGFDMAEDWIGCCADG